MRIKTSYCMTIIPCFDWTAVDDETYGGDDSDPIGHGATEQEAIDDLLWKMEDREP